MKRFTSNLLMLVAALIVTVAHAQDPKITGDQDGSSQQVEESDEAYRRRMELEDARYRDPTYTDPAGSGSRELEKIDTLPPESRENIRDQLVDVIMDNPDWKPGDALEEYPYEPTEAAQADADLLEREQAAWDEQIEKYHAREAEAFGAYRGPVAGPGNPSGKSGGQEGQQGGGDAQGGGQDGGQDGQDSSDQADRSAGTYQPQSDRQDEGPSTQGVSESALDFLMARQQGRGQSRQPPAGEPSPATASDDTAAQAGQRPPAPQSSPPAEPSQAEPSQAEPSQAEPSQAEPSQAEPSQAEPSQAEPDMRGIIAIEDLEKLEGMGDGSARGTPPEEDPDENPEDPRTPR